MIFQVIDADIYVSNQTDQQVAGQADAEPDICYLKTARNHWSETGSVPDFAFKLKSRNKQPGSLAGQTVHGGKAHNEKTIHEADHTSLG